MAGPIDMRVNPTEVNRLAPSPPIDWFERNLIGMVPLRYTGAVRRVYPGFVQLAAFMSMNLDRPIRAQIDRFCRDAPRRGSSGRSRVPPKDQRWPRLVSVGIYCCPTSGDEVSTVKLLPPPVRFASQLGSHWTGT